MILSAGEGTYRSNVRRAHRAAVHVTMMLVLVFAGLSPASAGSPEPESSLVQIAQADTSQADAERKLKPRYEPAAPEEKGWYNTDYLFGMTKGVARSTMHPGVKAPLFLLVVPLDIVILPFTAIGGLFG